MTSANRRKSHELIKSAVNKAVSSMDNEAVHTLLDAVLQIGAGKVEAEDETVEVPVSLFQTMAILSALPLSYHLQQRYRGSGK